MNAYLKGSLFDRLREPSKDAGQRNPVLLGNFLSERNSRKKMREAQSLVQGIFLLDRERRLFELHSLRSGNPYHYMSVALMTMTSDPVFSAWMIKWFRRKSKHISEVNYLLWGTFAKAGMTAVNCTDYDQLLEHFLAENDPISKNKTLSRLLEIARGCQNGRRAKTVQILNGYVGFLLQQKEMAAIPLMVAAK